MSPKERQKICRSCDGRIPVEALLCPYCGSAENLSNSLSQPQGLSQHHRSLQESLTAPYTPPPVSLKAVSVDRPLYGNKEQRTVPSAAPAPAAEAAAQEGAQNLFWPILLLSLGANLFVLGLLQFFFSEQGVLRLEWNSAHWFIYCLAAVPLAFFGWKRCCRISE